MYPSYIYYVGYSVSVPKQKQQTNLLKKSKKNHMLLTKYKSRTGIWKHFHHMHISQFYSLWELFLVLLKQFQHKPKPMIECYLLYFVCKSHFPILTKLLQTQSKFEKVKMQSLKRGPETSASALPYICLCRRNSLQFM